MKKQADYIKRIEIKRLWGRKDISWELRPDVNILSGVNGPSPEFLNLKTQVTFGLDSGNEPKLCVVFSKVISASP